MSNGTLTYGSCAMAAQSRAIAYSFNDISQSAMTGLGWIDFTKIITYLRYQRAIKLLAELIEVADSVSIDDTCSLGDLANSIKKIIRAIDTAIQLRTDFYKKAEVISKLKEHRDRLEEVWEDFSLFADKKAMEKLQASKSRMEKGEFITHQDFWSRLGVHD